MKERVGILKSKKQIVSILIVWMLAAACIVILVSVETPTVRGVDHILGMASLEDGDILYDQDGMVNNVVEWHDGVMHNITVDYWVDSGYTLIIPELNYISGALGETWVDFQGGIRIDVFGTLITSDNGISGSKTAFKNQFTEYWDGIFFQLGGQGTIVDCQFINPDRGVQFQPGSTLLAPIRNTIFDDYIQYGLKMEGVVGDTNIVGDMLDPTFFFDLDSSGTGLDVANGFLDISGSVSFISHGPSMPSVHITNAVVSLTGTMFQGSNSEAGNSIYIEDSNDTVLSNCNFYSELAGNYYIRTDASSTLTVNSYFDFSTGALTLKANENALKVPAEPILRNPLVSGGGYFDNSTINATGNSSITLQWWVDVYVEDECGGNPIENVPVWVKDRNGDPAEPPSKITDAGGMAEGFIVTELIRYKDDSGPSYGPFNISAENNSMWGYADPEPKIDISMSSTWGGSAIIVTVPCSSIPNTEPIVFEITTPDGVQSGLITIEYRLIDPDPGDAGDLYVEVYWWDDEPGSGWQPATQAGGDPITGLFNDTLYTFVWDSTVDFPDRYSTDGYIKIIPFDNYGNGTSLTTGQFTVDNMPPQLVSDPTATATNTTATIVWEMNKACNATVWYGLTTSETPDVSDCTMEATNNSESTDQSVTLTGLLPGRNYSYVIESTDTLGNKYTSAPIVYTFETEIYIELYEGWNMISMPPTLSSTDLGDVLSTIAGSWDIVEWYDNSDTDDQWKINNTSKPYGNDLDTYHPNRMGLWIHMLNDDTLILDHTVPDLDKTTVVSLLEGWNFIGYPSATTRSISAALGGMPYDQVQTYDAATSQWLNYDGGSGLLSNFELGRGYWIHFTGEYIWWSVDYV